MAIKPEAYNPEKDLIEKSHQLTEAGSAHTVSEIVITGPIAFWIIMLFVGMIFAFILAPYLGIKTKLGGDILSASQYILYLPGSLILPLIVSLWAGSRIGSSGRQIGGAVKAGVLNGVYIGVIYGIATTAIIIAIYYINPSILPNGVGLENFAISSIGIPIGIVIALTTLISFLSAARHVSK